MTLNSLRFPLLVRNYKSLKSLSGVFEIEENVVGILNEKKNANFGLFGPYYALV